MSKIKKVDQSVSQEKTKREFHTSHIHQVQIQKVWTYLGLDKDNKMIMQCTIILFALTLNL
jgi:hypothetical protein